MVGLLGVMALSAASVSTVVPATATGDVIIPAPTGVRVSVHEEGGSRWVRVAWDPIRWPAGAEYPYVRVHVDDASQPVCETDQWVVPPPNHCDVDAWNFTRGITHRVTVVAAALYPDVESAASAPVSWRLPIPAPQPIRPRRVFLPNPNTERKSLPFFRALKRRYRSPNNFRVSVPIRLVRGEDAKLISQRIRARKQSRRAVLGLRPGRYIVTRTAVFRPYVWRRQAFTLTRRSVYFYPDDDSDYSCSVASWTVADGRGFPDEGGAYNDYQGEYNYVLRCVVSWLALTPIEVRMYGAGSNPGLALTGSSVNTVVPTQKATDWFPFLGRKKVILTRSSVRVRGYNPRCVWSREAQRLRLGQSLAQVRAIIGGSGQVEIRGLVTVRYFSGCYGPRIEGPDLYLGFVGGRLRSIVYDR